MAEGRTSIAESENVLIAAGQCELTVLPRFGGKISSIRIGQNELLQQPLSPIAVRTNSMSFDQGDASGWDECLPSVGACLVKTEAGPAAIPDHGDLWRVEWERRGTASPTNKNPSTPVGGWEQGSGGSVAAGSSLTLTGRCFSLALELERSIAVSENERGWRLELSYRVQNYGKCAVPWSWAAHPLFACEECDRIVLPNSIRSLKVEGSGGERLGKSGGSVAWPIAELAAGGTADLSIVDRGDSGIGDKLFAGRLNTTENWCVLERVSAGLSIRVRFDSAATPYLGLWICYGGWPERPGPKQVCVAMEPSTAPVDSLAVSGPWSRELVPGESFSWPMQVEIERIER
jgi:galactose mutarotase-like enzyme